MRLRNTNLKKRTFQLREASRQDTCPRSQEEQMTMTWKGVMPAITTCFDEALQVDHKFMTVHCKWMIDSGCTGIVALGSLGEGATLTTSEKLAILRTCID